MPRRLYHTEPKVINTVQAIRGQSTRKYLEIATHNQNKIKEYQRILKGYEVVGIGVDADEIQSLDPMKVITSKAKEAYRLNGYNPILVEDVSVDIRALGNRPGPFVRDFMEESNMRKLIAEEWLNEKDRSALARVLLAIYDGVEVYIWQGTTEGSIAEKQRGMNGFDWDDIFIPKESKKTFAEMDSKEKDSYSMRRKALLSFLEKPYETKYPIWELPEPYEQELQRVQMDKLSNGKSTQFAYRLECLEDENKPNKELTAPNYSKIRYESNSYFTRYLPKEDSKSLGLMLTDVDRGKLKLYQNGNPVLWEMGPERRHLALAQRVEYFMQNQDPEVHKILDELEAKKDKFPRRINRRSTTIEQALRIQGYETATQALSLKEIGYKKLSSLKLVSRTKSSNFGLFNIIGKHARSMYAVGSLPFTSGWRDVIVMSAIGHMLVFVHRNNINAIDFKNQLSLIKEARQVILDLKLSKKATNRALDNIGAAIGSNPKDDLEKAKELYKIGVKTFRIYTINSDPRVIETAKAIRNEFGDNVEIFVGQLVDKKQCQALITPDIRVDGFIFGHGGGRQCTSATNGMALATLEEIYQTVIDHQFNNVSILVEGGVGTYVGAMMLLGVDCILRNAQFTNCIIEQGDLFFEAKSGGEIVQPYHGSASAATMIIESYNKKNAEQRLFYSGRTKNVEGKSGYIYYKERANSMAFYIDEFKHYAARTLADLGVESIWEMREFLHTNHEELFRLMTPEAVYTGTAYRS